MSWDKTLLSLTSKKISKTHQTREQYNVVVQCYQACDKGVIGVLISFLGEGALILSLTNNTHFDFGKKKICNILIKAKPGEKVGSWTIGHLDSDFIKIPICQFWGIKQIFFRMKPTEEKGERTHFMRGLELWQKPFEVDCKNKNLIFLVFNIWHITSIIVFDSVFKKKVFFLRHKLNYCYY